MTPYGFASLDEAKAYALSEFREANEKNTWFGGGYYGWKIALLCFVHKTGYVAIPTKYVRFDISSFKEDSFHWYFGKHCFVFRIM